MGLFAVCWLPSHVIYLYRSYHYSEVDTSMSHFIASVCARILAFSNSCVNPFALYLLSKSFQKQFNKQLCCCCPPLSRRGNSRARGNTHLSSMKSTQNHTVASFSLANGNNAYHEGCVWVHKIVLKGFFLIHFQCFQHCCSKYPLQWKAGLRSTQPWGV